MVDGARNLRLETAQKYARALGLAAGEEQYFLDLVLFNQATTLSERQDAYARLVRGSGRRGRDRKRLAAHEVDYYAYWFVPVVRELVALPGFREDPEWVAAQLTPPITAAQAKFALETLGSLGFIERVGVRGWRQSAAVLATDPEVRSLHVAGYHRSMLERSWEALDRFDSEDRDISGVTFRMSRDDLPRFKALCVEFRKQVMELEANAVAPDSVFHVAIAAIPVAVVRGRSKR